MRQPLLQLKFDFTAPKAQILEENDEFKCQRIARSMVSLALTIFQWCDFCDSIIKSAYAKHSILWLI